MLAADLAAGKINIFLVFVVAEDKSGEQLFLCYFRHRTLNKYAKYFLEHALFPEQHGAADSNDYSQRNDDGKAVGIVGEGNLDVHAPQTAD